MVIQIVLVGNQNLFLHNTVNFGLIDGITQRLLKGYIALNNEEDLIKKVICS